jgi:hypothetical protein
LLKYYHHNTFFPTTIGNVKPSAIGVSLIKGDDDYNNDDDFK